MIQGKKKSKVARTPCDEHLVISSCEAATEDVRKLENQPLIQEGRSPLRVLTGRRERPESLGQWASDTAVQRRGFLGGGARGVA